MSKQVVEKKSTAVGSLISADEMNEVYDDVEFTAKDAVIPKILPQQGMSKFVTERKAAIGDYCNSVTGEVIGSIEKPLDFIPCAVEKLWVVQQEVNGKFEYVGMEPINRSNENRQWEEDVNGTKTRYDWNYLVYLLRPADVMTLEDVQAGRVPIPYTISFRRTSVKAGKKLMTQMYLTNKNAQKSPFATVMSLTGKMTSNDKGTYVVLDTSVCCDASPAEELAAFKIWKQVRAGSHKVDHSDLETKQAPKGRDPKETEF